MNHDAELPADLRGPTRALVDFALASMLTPVLLLDGGGFVEAASPGALTDLDEPPDLLRGRSILEVLGISVGEVAKFDDTARSARVTSLHGRALRWRALSLGEARADGGWLVEFHLGDDTATPDVDERIERLDDLLTDLADRHERLDRYTGLISHDLQAPTRRLLSFVELLRGDLADATPDAMDSLGGIERSARYLLRFTTELLQFSRLGRLRLELQPVDAQAVFDETVEQLRGELDDLDAVVTVARPLPSVDASPTFLAIVFQNLIENALTYRRDESPRIDVSWTATDGQIAIAVTDNASGIAFDLREAVFQPARRLVPGDLEHTGLGLATVRDILERFGGTIHVETSELGVGTTFVITLPATHPVG